MKIIGLPLAGIGMMSSFVLPDPEHMIVFLGALGLGIGAGVGAGYAAYLKSVSKARLEVYQEEDKVKKASTLAKLETANEELAEMRRDVAENRRQIETLDSKLMEERELNEKLRADLISYALSVLQQQGYIVKPEGGGKDEETHE